MGTPTSCWGETSIYSTHNTSNGRIEAVESEIISEVKPAIITDSVLPDGKYRVKKSEGKWRIAKNFGITVEELEALNPQLVDGLKENDIITIQLYGSQPVSIILPGHVSFAVVETETVIKGQTAASSYKPAVLERNIKTSVPPFIEVGDIVVINTLNSSYVEKAKK